jgi:nucleoside-diphosphate kinase
MAHEQTLVIVKPDGIAKGLVGEILLGLNLYGLRVVQSFRARLQRELVEALYGDEHREIYFLDVVNWVSSGPVLVFKVEGPEAVSKVKWEIIGRYPNGLRGKYSENWIKNVAHAPDSLKSACRELRLLKNLFEEHAKMNQIRFKDKMVFALTGMSECGKSTVGKYLDTRGIKRLKIVKIFENVRQTITPTQEENLAEFVKREESRDPYALWNLFLDELLRQMESLGVDTVSIESLYGGGLGPYIQQALGDRFCIVYIDIPLEVRLERQMIREGLKTLDDARRLLLPRDKIKAESGIPALKEIADEIIDNSRTTEDLHKAIDSMIARRCGK